jgi:hypothetical protein
MNEPKKLKPIVFFKDKSRYYSQNTHQQKMLLQAMATSDNPEVWKKIVGFKSMADVYRTLDKMAIRKEYHAALANNKISFDYLVGGIKTLSETSKSDSVRLQCFQTFLNSLGLNKYEEAADSGNRNWEDIVLDAIKEKSIESTVVGEYTVEQPNIPQSVQKRIKDEKDLGKELYEK